MEPQPADWVTLATTPPSSAEEIDLEDNPVRQCDKDVVTWLRVHSRDLPLAWDMARQIIS